MKRNSSMDRPRVDRSKIIDKLPVKQKFNPILMN